MCKGIIQFSSFVTQKIFSYSEFLRCVLFISETFFTQDQCWLRPLLPWITAPTRLFHCMMADQLLPCDTRGYIYAISVKDQERSNLVFGVTFTKKQLKSFFFCYCKVKWWDINEWRVRFKTESKKTSNWLTFFQ